MQNDFQTPYNIMEAGFTLFYTKKRKRFAITPLLGIEIERGSFEIGISFLCFAGYLKFNHKVKVKI